MKKISLLLSILLISIFFWNCSNDDENFETTVEEIDPNAFYVDQDHPDAKDENDGKYIKDGGTGPWKTIQKMLNTLEPGEIGYVRASKDRYLGTISTTAFGQIAFNITKSGTVDNPIIISGFPGERPIVGLDHFEDAKDANTGGFVATFNTSYVTIRNFEISNVSGTGIFTDPDGNFPNKGMIFEDLHIYNVSINDNGGCIRLDYCNQCIVRNNILHDVYDQRVSNNLLNDFPAGLGAGIHGFQPSECIIENNLLYNLSKGVFQKQADQDHRNSHIVRNNIFRDITGSAFTMQIQGAGLAAPRNAEFYNNIVEDVESAVWVPLQDVGEQGDGLKIYNNTVINSETLGRIQGVTNIEVFNNIIVGDKPKWSINTNKTTIFLTIKPDTDIFKNSIKYYDNNLYYDLYEHWIINNNDLNNTVNVLDFLNWQNTLEPDLGLPFTPDITSRITNPLFTNLSNQDYTLQPTSPALSEGRGGEYATIIGAVMDGVKIGPDWSLD